MTEANISSIHTTLGFHAQKHQEISEKIDNVREELLGKIDDTLSKVDNVDTKLDTIILDLAKKSAGVSMALKIGTGIVTLVSIAAAIVPFFL